MQIDEFNKIYIVDVMQQMNFLGDCSQKRTNIMMKQLRDILYIEDDWRQSQDVTQNLFKICCAILNLIPKQKCSRNLQDSVLKKHIERVKFSFQYNREFLIIDQLKIIKELVNRKAFSISAKQIYIINTNFINMSQNYKNENHFAQRKLKLDRIARETQPYFQPKINSFSRDIDYIKNYPRSLTRTDQMHEYAEKYKEQIV